MATACRHFVAADLPCPSLTRRVTKITQNQKLLPLEVLQLSHKAFTGGNYWVIKTLPFRMVAVSITISGCSIESPLLFLSE